MGCFDLGGFLVGLLVVITAGASIAYGAATTPDSLLVSSAAVTTGVTMMYAAATDSTMVMDLSYTAQALPNYYIKGGGSIVIDFKNDNANYYTHVGGGKGHSSGIGYSVGMVDNYDSPEDYARHFVDVNVGCYLGIDHCWDPLSDYDDATQAWAFSFSKGVNYGVGYDYYFQPKEIFSW